jgi:Protein of unknown function (DUF1616)
MTAGTHADTDRADVNPAGNESPGTADGQSRRGNTRRRAGIAVGFTALLLAVALAAAFPKQLKHQWELSVVRQQTPYTQLYFTAPASIPSSLTAGQRNTFDFTIENDEGRAYSYTYVVTLKDSRAQQVSKETVTVNSGATVTRAVTVVPKDKDSRYLVSVAIPSLNQSIQFYGETS